MFRIRSAVGFCLRVEVVDLLAVAIFDDAAAKLHGRRQGAVIGGEFVRHQHHAFEFFEASQILIDGFHDSFVEALNFRICDQSPPRTKRNAIGARPLFQQRKIRRYDHRGKFAPVAEDGRDSDQRIELQRILDRLRRDEFSARSLDQIFLAIGDREISVGVDVANVAGLEPVSRRMQRGFRPGDSSSL